MVQCVPKRIQLPYVFQNLLDSLVAVLDFTTASPLRPSITELDGDGIALNQPPQKGPPVTPLYANCSIPRYDAE